MSTTVGATPATAPADAAAALLTAAEVVAVRDRWVAAEVPEDAAEREALLRELEALKASLTAVQAHVVVAIDASTRQEEAARGVPSHERGRGVPAKVGLALRESPATARVFVGAARVWATEMPHTFAALREGRLSGWRATVLARETGHLSVEARARIDAELCTDPGTLAGAGTRELTARVKRRAAELDPAACAERARRAQGERSVWIRPAPDTMTYVTALLPVAQGVGVYAGLRRAADAARATGDGRSRGQLMADTLVERVTGRETAEAVPVAVNLVVSDATLLGAGHEPGALVEDGVATAVVPAQVARNLVAHGLDADAAWVRRLYADPGGNLVAASSRTRFFADGLAALLRARDQGLCRMPYCDAPVRHLDHVLPAGDDGSTTLSNGQGLCEACNQVKNTGALRQTVETPGDVVRTERHTVRTTTDTGHVHTSTAPAAPRPARIVRAAGATGRLGTTVRVPDGGPPTPDRRRPTAPTGAARVRPAPSRAAPAAGTAPPGRDVGWTSPVERALAERLRAHRAHADAG